MSNTNRRKFLGTAAALCAGAATASAKPLVPADNGKPLIHHVFFWLKNPGSKADREQLIEGVKTLSRIETVRKIYVGTVADTEKRDVVDASWDVSEMIFFDDPAGQSVYQTHPIHLAFVKNYSHLWEKVVVYDAMTV
ncbi:Dabb family protein [Chitinophaga sp. CB10]|uniref:Dabb family protein n=1 Tax=Chitinophaga sp. CB10 TaxID=1891659 RepID=UPI000AE2FD58|nr:Dabb family protein [Chitinophaga sp. CB10]